MSYRMNLGAWGSVFAVPSSLVDRHLKLASSAQLKVLLYLLRNAEKNCEIEDVSKALSIKEPEVKNAIDFWAERGLISVSDSVISPNEMKESDQESAPEKPKSKPKTEKKETPIPRVQRPSSAFVSQLLEKDEDLSALMEEAQIALKKPLSSGDTATLVMLYHSYGLPCDVLALLIHYCVSIGRDNIRAIERLGVSWSENGICSVEDAEKEIDRLTQNAEAWKKISDLFGIRLVGKPTKSQLEHSYRWLHLWHFSDEMLLEAYERCVNTKGEYSIRYIDGILKKWNENGIKSIDALKASEEKRKPAACTNSKKKPGVFDSSSASYDISSYEEQSLFDD